MRNTVALLGAFCLGDFFSMAVVGGLSYGFGCKALGELGDPLLRQSTAPSMKGWKIISLRRPRKLKRAHKDLAGEASLCKSKEEGLLYEDSGGTTPHIKMLPNSKILQFLHSPPPALPPLPQAPNNIPTSPSPPILKQHCKFLSLVSFSPKSYLSRGWPNWIGQVKI
ncbi:hypothetical protein CK203_011345 [Vitis vinifera]|uniref:Uncharacterized protein n=1 Tax=Vitis vinifera TaxID=29760 RepID=A0A438JY95_VITVI|nr:hypothetical protein CK203_011345 [Vitis vinifera]